MFVLPNCPHCKLALKFHEELMAENPQYKDIPITIIDENAQADIANKYDYYYVPCYYLGQEKLFEGHAEKDDVEKVFKTVLEA